MAPVDDDPLTALVNWLRPTWHADAACKEHPELSWFPALGEASEPQKAICRSCLVQSECREDALEHGVWSVGIWGGLSAKQRRTQRAATATTVQTEFGSFITAAEYARRAGLDPNEIARRARSGMLPGAQRNAAGYWMIPIDELGRVRSDGEHRGLLAV